MKYREIQFAQFPYIYFAHDYKTQAYRLHFGPETNCIEITSIEQGDIIQTFADGRQLELHSPGILVNVRDREYTLESPSPVHRHSTICFIADIQVRELSTEEVIEFSNHGLECQNRTTLTAILPECFPVTSSNSQIEKRIKQIVHLHSEQTPASRLSCTGLIIDLLGEITEECIRNAMTESDHAVSFSSVVYVRKAMQYITHNLEQKLYVDDIASHLEISSGYLSNIFKSVTGQTLVDYINRTKLNRIKELLTTNPDTTLKQAGESVGIYDENYLSRIFKKYTGLTAREYRTLQIRQD